MHTTVSASPSCHSAPKTLAVSCDRNIGNNLVSNIWSLTPVSDMGLIKEFNFLGDANVFGSEQAVDGSWIGTGHWKNHTMTRSLEFLPATPHSLGGKRCW